MTFQVADVDRILIGATPLTKAGNKVTLRADDGEILHKETGRKIDLIREGGVYIMMMYFLVDAGPPEPQAVQAEDFHRPGP